MPKAPKLKSVLKGLQHRTDLRRKQAAAVAAQEVMNKNKHAGSTRKERVRAKNHSKSTSDASLGRIMKTLYTHEDRVLLVGEGNFSFARTLIESYLNTGHQVVATAFDEESVAMEKYGDAETGENVRMLRESDAEVIFGVDATKLKECRELKGKTFTRIIFNFPHVGAGIKNQDRNIQANQRLITSFLESAQPFLAPEEEERPGEVHITLKSKAPYDAWRIKSLARSIDPPLHCGVSFQFDCRRWPGYEHRRTLGFKEGLSSRDNEEIKSKDPRTYVFRRAKITEEDENKTPKPKPGIRRKQEDPDGESSEEN